MSDSEQEDFDYGEEDGGEYGDYGDDGEYKDYPEDDAPEDDNIADFSFAQLDQVGIGADIGDITGQVLGTTIEGSSDLSKLQATRDQRTITPLEKFKIQVLDIISKRRVILGINQSDKVEIVNGILKLHLVQYKNPLAFVLGYIGSVSAEYNDRKQIPKVFESMYTTEIDTAVVLKYIQWWKRISR